MTECFVRLRKEIYDSLLKKYGTQEKVEQVVNDFLLEAIRGNVVHKSEIEKLRKRFMKKYKKLEKTLNRIKLRLLFQDFFTDVKH